MSLSRLGATFTATLLALGMTFGLPTPTASADGGTGGYLLDWGDPDATDTSSFDYVVMQPWEYQRIAAMKRANPGLRVLMYKNVGATRKDTHESGMSSTGVTYAEAQANDWLLHDASGAVIAWSDWPGLYPVDVADPGYRAAWLDDTRADLARGAWDGVLMDDTLSRLTHTTVGDRTPVEIPTDQAMRTATSTFLADAGTAIKRDGWLVFANATDVRYDTWKGVLSSWRPYVTGYLHEFYVKWGFDRSAQRFGTAEGNWMWKMKLTKWAAKKNVPVLAVTYSDRDDLAAQAYHRGTWLLTWNGRTGASVFVPDGDGMNHWTRQSTIDLGRPTAAARRDSNGVYRRKFERGRVFVNPTDVGRSIQLKRAFRKPNRRITASFTLKPRSAMLLQKAGPLRARRGHVWRQL